MLYMKKFYTKSLTLASYISAKTGQVSKIVYPYKQKPWQNCHEFNETMDVFDAVIDYNDAKNNNLELTVSLIDFNKYVDEYKIMTKQKKAPQLKD